ncbi:sensory box histidine kinase/response regulator [Enhygromyxa salina]|uniref:histidine kinase n=1 Tax=Enhygromyxa salina TaxID=215803 RepID=A0A0C1ZNJ5_9BACT|nr:PAS domain-containing hybrid sensor histidine kinase/response regulator [Enhygromyxa salina]KIG19044.1 sensory box histidine kinase/response regulator [Enhygromyxa salina]
MDARLSEEITRRMGVCPSFFGLARANETVSRHLWLHAQGAYLDNPLPALFKERLFVYLSRFCGVRYCLTRHAAFLMGRGYVSGDPACPPMSGPDVLELLKREPPSSAEIVRHSERLLSVPGRPMSWPAPNSDLEDAIFGCCVAVFLHSAHAVFPNEALRHALSPHDYCSLVELLSFVRVAHFWTESFPGLTHEHDVEQLLSEQIEIATWIDAQYSSQPNVMGHPSVLHTQLVTGLSSLRRLVLTASRGDALMGAEALLRTEVLQASFNSLQAQVGAARPNSVEAYAWVHDAKTHEFSFVGSAYQRIFQHVGDSHKDRSAWLELVHPEDRHLAKASLEAGLAGAAFDVEYRVTSPARGLRWVSERGTPIHDDHGHLERVVGVVCDITDRRRQESQHLQRAQRMHSVGTLAARVAHDFNNLLMVITGNSELLADHLDSDGPAMEYLRPIGRAAERAAEHVERLLAFARKNDESPRTVNLNEEIEELRHVFQHLVGSSVELEIRCDPAISAIECIPTDIEQILLNLVVNAKDAVAESGRITIETRVADAEDQGAPWVQLLVSDTGCGMSPETMSKVFEPFFTTKDPGQGTGLGLATIYRIVEDLGGRTTVESELGRGTTFTLWFPGCTQQSQQKGTLQPLDRTIGAETVLLCDDDAMVRRVLSQVLRASGYVVLEAIDGLAALDVAKQHADSIDMVITDVNMPRLDGHGLADALVAEGLDVPVILLTGYGETPGVERPGVHRVELAKPIRRHDLLLNMRDCFEAHARSSEAKRRPAPPK